MNVLILDDSLTIRMDLHEALSAAGCATTPCATLAEARRAIAAAVPAVIVLGLHLPDGDGLDFLATLKAEPATADVPVILLAGSAEVRERARAGHAEADAYAPKPYEAAALVATARRLARTASTEADRPLVLLIDDSVTFREALRGQLVDAGYRVVTAGSGEEGLEQVAAWRPHAVVVDGELPGIDGATVLQRIRLNPALRRTPCLLLTGSERTDDELSALEAGADAFARKDADIALVLARLGALVRAAGAPDASLEGLEAPIAWTILAVDDSPTYLQALEAALTAEGFAVVPARSGEAAIALLEEQHVDGVVLDAEMPGLSGIETCRRIKAHPAWRELPLAILSAEGGARAMIEALNHGADDYIVKAEDFEVVKGRMRALMRRKQLEDENRLRREGLLRQELEAAETRAARELAETRAQLLADLESKNAELEQARARAEAATRAKSEFLAHMSHEIRTPLTALIGTADLLSRTGLTPQQERYVALFRRSGDNLLTIVNDILDLAKLESGMIELEMAPFDLIELIERTTELHAVRAQEKELELVALLPGQGTLPAVGDAHRLSQVLNNLLANAIKFTAAGTIEVSLATGEPDGVRLSVADTGIGLADDKLETIFQAFSQADASTTRQFGGTGLGLTICRQLAEKMGGRIWAEQRPAGGTVFHVALPLTTPAGAAEAPVLERRIPAAPEPIAPADATPGRGLRILLAEDTPENRVIFSAFLEGTPHRLTLAEDGAQAVERFCQEPFDLVLMDMQMPVMDGYAATRAIRAWEQAEGRSPIPIVALTAFALNTEVAKTRAAGCTGHVTKPITRGRLLQAIDEIARRTGAMSEVVEVEDYMAPLLPAYFEARRQDVADLRQASAGGDLEAIGGIAHRLTSVGGTYDFDRITELGQALYACVGRRDAEAIAPLVEALAAFLATVSVVVVASRDGEP